MPQGGGSLITHRWQPITDLPDDWQALCRADLHTVHSEWAAARALLDDPGRVQQLQEQLMTVWAIETGIIERLYEVIEASRSPSPRSAWARSNNSTRMAASAPRRGH